MRDSSIGRTKLQIPSSLVVFRRRHRNLKWVQVETNQKFVCKSIADDSSTPDEETQNDDNEEDNDVATTQSISV
ncbi:hypothetical protein Bca52824_032076 [Brassica carinata]|uniref:Uncharacterized protein n=1 Tax=Brassica carinata TaxID=52824 RepID=A0A8X7SBA1_BRACI|nr:hypothetical protein Bca52824_032076 [Brassica carinata]